MSPLGITMLIYFHTKAKPSDHIKDATMQRALLRQFVADGLLSSPHEMADWLKIDDFKLTEKGRAYVDALCQMPMPERHIEWAVPGFGVIPS